MGLAAAITVASPVILILLLTAALYLPPVQKWAVDTASAYASESMEMDISVEKVRLSFPLDLTLEGIRAVRRSTATTNGGDSVAHVGRVVVNVALRPLFNGDVNITALELNSARINTLDIIPQAKVKGTIGRLALTDGNPVAHVKLSESIAILEKAVLDDAHLDVALHDTTVVDTAESTNEWVVRVRELSINNSDVLLHMSGDSMRVGLQLGEAVALNGDLDLGKSIYKVAQLKMKNSAVSYDTDAPQLTNAEALDYNHISLADVSLQIDSISYAEPDIRLNIRSLAMREKSGLKVDGLKATIALDTTAVSIDGVLHMPASVVKADVFMGFNAFDSEQYTTKKNIGNNNNKTQKDNLDNTFRAKVDAAIDLNDFSPLLSDVAEERQKLRPMHLINIKSEAMGTMDNIRIERLSVDMPGALSLDAKGNVNGLPWAMNDIYSPQWRMDIDVDAHTHDLSFIKNFMDGSTAEMIAVPSMHINAQLHGHGADYNVAMRMEEGGGTAQATAAMNLQRMAYSMNATVNKLNLGHFVHGMGLGTLSATADISGQGTDVMASSTHSKGVVSIAQMGYQQYDMTDITADFELENGRAQAKVYSNNNLINGNITLDALVNTKRTDVILVTDMQQLDLHALGIVDVPLSIQVCGHVELLTDNKSTHACRGEVSDIIIRDSANVYHPDDIVMNIYTAPDTTYAKVDCGDFALHLNASEGYERLMVSSDRMTEEIDRQLKQRTIDQQALRDVLPEMSLVLHSEKENPVYRFMKYLDIDYDVLSANITTSPRTGINGDLDVNGLQSQGIELDTIQLHIRSTDDPLSIVYNGRVTNAKPNERERASNNKPAFNVLFDGKLLEHGVSMNAAFYDSNDELGLQAGVEAAMEEEGIRLHVTPHRPVIAYETFSVNSDNYLLLAANGRISANISLVADNGTAVQVYTTDNGEDDNRLQDITLSTANLDIGRLLSAIPYAPNVTGTLNGDLHFVQENDEAFSISASLDTRQLVYEGCQIGNLSSELVYMPKDNGDHYIDGLLTLNEEEVGTIVGSYNFDSKAINAELNLNQFPLEIINGFIPDRIIGMEGLAEGQLTVMGTTDYPQVNGEMYLSNGYLISEPYSIRMRFDDDPIRIVDSRLLFENFQVYANNDQPLTAMGALDFSDTNHMKLNMLMQARNFLLIDSKETSLSEAYGKAYVNFFASISGELSRLNVRGKVDVLPTTDVFYILRDSPLTTDNQLQELVTFTNFEGEDAQTVTHPTPQDMDMRLDINLMSGAHAKCWLNDSRTNYVDVIGEGELKMQYVGDEMKLTGRYVINEGEMKYSLPIIPLKTFTISNGSYVEFTGDVMNPRLDITAKETRKASVSSNGTNRLVTFNTGVQITKTLNDMGLEFIIEAPEDNTVSDELNMLSKEERGKLAVTMLTTGMYLADGNTSAFSMNSALNSFLQSEISAIAGSALKTLDMNFGMDNSTEDDGTVHTNYSFKFAKRFWNNRLSISVGGKISTGPDVSGQNKSFFDNVEAQYRLSDVSNKYLRLFYNRSVYDYLEGYVGQYGAGFMWKKKIQSLREIFYPSLSRQQMGAPRPQSTTLLQPDTAAVRNIPLTTKSDTIQRQD